MFTTLGMFSAHRGPPVLASVLQSERNTEPVVTFNGPAFSLDSLLVVLTSTGGGVSTYGVPAGSTEISSNVPTRIRAFYYFSPGAYPGGTMDISFATSALDDKSTSLALVFNNVDIRVPPLFVGSSQPSNATPTPPSVTGSGTGWVAGNNHLIAAMAFAIETADIATGGYPTNCPLYQQSFNAGALGLGTGLACATTTALTFAPNDFSFTAVRSSNTASLIVKGFP